MTQVPTRCQDHQESAIKFETLKSYRISPPAAVIGTVRVWDLTTTDELGISDFRDIGSAAVGPSGELLVAIGWDLVVLDRTAKH
jgi:hypothetical protein